MSTKASQQETLIFVSLRPECHSWRRIPDLWHDRHIMLDTAVPNTRTETRFINLLNFTST